MILSTAVAGLFPAVAPATNLYWDSDGASPGGSSTTTAPGTWGTSLFWSTDPTGSISTGAWVEGSTAVFSAGTDVTGGYTVTVSGSHTLGTTGPGNAMIFEEGSVSVSGGTFTLAAGLITVAPGRIASISGVLTGGPGGSGSTALSLDGGGRLVLSGANTYAGDVDLFAGALEVSSDARLGNSANLLNFRGAATLSASGSFSSARPIALYDNGTIETISGQNTFNGAISGTGGLSKRGVGTLVLPATNSYSGGTSIGAGTLFITADSALGNASGGITFTGGTLSLASAWANSRPVTLIGNGTISPAGTDTFNGVISGAGTLTVANGGAIRLSGANTYSGGTVINPGTVVVSNNTNLGNSSGGVTISGGTLFTVGSFSTARTINATTSGVLLPNTGTTLTVSGVIAGSGPSTLTKSGAGTLRLTGANTYSGTFNVNAGEVQVAGGAFTPSALSIAETGGSSGSLSLGGTGSLSAGSVKVGDSGAGTLIQSGGTNSVSSSLYVGYGVGSSGNYALSGGALNISSGAWTVANSGAATMSISGASTVTASGGNDTIVGFSAAGVVNQSGGTVSIANALRLGLNSSASGRYTLTGGSLSTAGGQVVGDSGAGTFVQTGGINSVTGGSTLILGSQSTGAGLYSLGGTGTLSASGLLVGHLGDATFQQSGGYAGPASLFIANGASSGGSYNLTGGTLAVFSDLAVGVFGSGVFTQSGGSVSANKLQLDRAGGTGVYSLSSGSLSVFGGGFILGDAATGFGSFSQTGGAVTASGGFTIGTVGSSSGRYSFDGGTLDLNNAVIGGGGLGTFVQTGGVATVSNGLTFGASSGASGIYDISSGTLDVTGGRLRLGAVGGSSGQFTLGNGHVSVPGIDVGYDGTGTFVQTGGTFTSTGDITVANSLGPGKYTLSAGLINTVNETVGGGPAWTNPATFVQSGGTHNISGVMTIAGGGGSSGTFQLSGGSLNVTSHLQMGISSQPNATGGTFTQSGGTATVGGNLTIAQTAPSAGLVTINSGSTSVGGSVYVSGNSSGSGGDGVLRVTGGSLDIAGALKIYNVAGAAITLDGGSISAASLDTSGLPGLFDFASGTLSLSSPLWIESNAPLGSSHNISAGKRLNTAKLTIGNFSSGTLTISGGGRVDTTPVFPDTVALSTGAYGEVNVTDAGSIWNLTSGHGLGSASFLRVGQTGNALLSITDGGVVNVQGAVGVAQTSGQGTLSLSDSGSAMHITDSLFVGGEINSAGGTGSVLVSNQAQLDVGQLTRIWNSAAFIVGSDSTVSTGGLDIRGGVNSVGINSRINVGPLGMTLGGTSGITLSSDASKPGTIALAGNLTYTGGGTAVISSGVIGGGEIPGLLDLAAGNRTFSVADGPNGVDLSISASISNGGLIKTGGGTMQLNLPNSYAGPTDIQQGAIIIGFGDALPIATELSIASGASFVSGGFSQTVGSLQGAGSVLLSSGATLSVGGAGGSTTFSGPMSGSGSLVKQGPGTLEATGALSFNGGVTVNNGMLVLTGAKTFSGPINLNGSTADFGILSVGADNALGNSGNSLNFAGGRLRVTSSFATNRAIALNLGNGTFDILAGQTFTPQLSMSGSGGLNKVGAGILALSVNATYQGSTNLLEGTLRIAGSSSDRIPTTSVLTMASGTTLDLNNNNQSIATLIGDGSILLGAATLTTGSGDSWTQFDGAISGGGAVVKNGNGTIYLTGDSSFGGGLTATAGEASLLGNNTFTGSISIGPTGTVSANSEEALGASTNQIKLGGTFSAVGTFTNNHVIDIANTNPSVSVASGKTLTQAADISGAPSLFGTFHKTGPGTLKLTTAASMTAAFVSVDGGVLSLAQNATMTGVTNAFTVLTGATLELDNTNANVTNRINNSTAISLSGGTLRFLGAAGNESSESFGQLNQSPGASTVVATAASGGGAHLSFSGLSGGLYPHATLNFQATNLGASETVLFPGRAAGFMGARYTINDVDYADYNVTTGVIPVSDYQSTFTTNANVRLTADANQAIATIRTLSLNATSQAVKVTQTGALTLDGILKLGGNTASISGSTVSNSTSNYLYVHTSGGDLTIGSALKNSTGGGGTLALVKSGPGTAILASTDTSNHNLSGGIYLNDGTIQISSDANLGANLASTNDLFFYGGTLATTGSTSFGSGRTLTFNVNGGGIHVAASQTLTSSVSNQLVASSANAYFNKTGAGTFIISADNNNYDAKVNVIEGTLQLHHTNALGDGASPNNSTITLHPTSSLTLRSDGPYPANFRSDVVVLDNSPPGNPATINTERLTSQGGGTQGAYQLGGLKIGNSTLVNAGTDGRLQFTNTVVLQGNATFSNSRDLILTGQVTGTGTLTKTGPANMILGADPNGTFNDPSDDGTPDTKNNTYIGLTKISQGKLYLNKQPGTNAIAGPIELSGGELILLQPRQIADTSNLLLSAGLFDVNGKNDTVKTINNTGAEIRVINGGSLATQNTSMAGANALLVIGNPVGGGRPGGPGNPMLETVTGKYSTTGMDVSDGTTIVNPGGILEIGSGGLFFSGDLSPQITLVTDAANPGRAVLSGDTSFTGLSGTAQFINSGTPPTPGTVDLGGASRRFDVNNGTAAVDMQFNSVRIINGGLRKEGLGTLRLTTASEYALGTIVSGGTLEVANSLALGTGAISLTNSATLSLKSNLPVTTFTNDVNAATGSIAIGPDGAGSTGTFQLGRLSIGGATITVLGDSSGILEFSNTNLTGAASINNQPKVNLNGVITGAFGITKLTGGGTLTIGGTLANTYTGNTTVQAGVLALNKTAGVNAMSGNLIAQNGTARWLASDQLPDTTTVSLLTSSSVVDLNGQHETIATLNMTAGTVQTAGGSLSVTGSVTSNSSNQTATISGNLSFPLGAHTVSVANGAAATDLAISATLAGVGSITKSGAGTLILSGPNNLTGGITITDGVVGVASAAALGASGPVTVAGGTLRTVAAINSDKSITITGSSIDTAGFDSTFGALNAPSGTFTKTGAGALSAQSLNLANVTVATGTLRTQPRSLTGANTLARITGSLSIAPGAALDLNDNDLAVTYGTSPNAYNSVFNAVISGFGSTSGITSSTSDGSQILALFDNALVGATEWLGQAIATNTVIGKYTYFGDANLDGQVTGDDYTVIDANLNTAPPPGLAWLNGDMNLDGTVTGDDYTVIDANLSLGNGNPLSPAALISPAAGLSSLSSVPEPTATVALLLTAGLVAPRRRRVAACLHQVAR